MLLMMRKGRVDKKISDLDNVLLSLSHEQRLPNQQRSLMNFRLSSGAEILLIVKH